MKPRYALGSAALMIGSAVNYFGDLLVGFKIELWTGLSYFGGLLLLDVFVVPLVSGLAVAWVFGHGGKWLCYFPPMIVRALAYIQLAVIGPIPPGTSELNFIFWCFFVILAIEAAAFGGILGEVFLRRIYTRPEAARLADQALPPRVRAARGRAAAQRAREEHEP
jgi:hypothetical protein